MTSNIKPIYATDQEIYDLLMSGKQKITETVLYKIASSRGIFYSPKSSRDDLAMCVAILPHDYCDLKELVDSRESAKRGEKTTSVVLNTQLDTEALRSAICHYQDSYSTEGVSSQLKGRDAMVMNVSYDEIDHSRTRLIQRQEKELEIEITREENGITVRMPANEKARKVVEHLKSQLESIKRVEIKTDEIELSHLLTPIERTSFFISLIRGFEDYHRVTVSNLKVALYPSSDSNNSIDIEANEDEENAGEEILSYVRHVDLNGHNVIASDVYHGLQHSGYFIAGIKWESEQKSEPYHKILFDVQFENRQECKGFRYAVRYKPRLVKGNYAADFKTFRNGENAPLFRLIETVSRSILSYPPKNDEEEEV